MLKLLFSWLDGHPAAYAALAAVALTALLRTVARSLWQQKAGSGAASGDRWFLLFAVVFLFAGRWPFLLDPREFNPDESQLIAGAITLAHDPVFWRAVDGTTSGPLNFYALLPLHSLGLPLDYFAARLLGLGLVSVALIACYRWLRRFAPPAPARLALLPALTFFALTTDHDFVHYSSEHVSLLLVALSAYGLFRPAGYTHGDRVAMLLGAFFAGLLPWAKIQTAPLAVALVGCGLWLQLAGTDTPRPSRWRTGRHLIALAAAPSLIAVTLLVFTGQWGAFVQSYLRQNLLYAGGGTSLLTTVADLANDASVTHAFQFFALSSATFLILASALYAFLRPRPGRFFWATAACSVAATICILTPHRPFLHYLLLAVVPLTLWCGAALGELWPRLRYPRSFALALLAIGCLWPIGVRCGRPGPDMFGRFAESWRRPIGFAGAILRTFSAPGDLLGVWGWRCELYVDGQIGQATRDAHTVWSIANSPHRDYYRARYLADLQRHQPTFFIDGVGPESFYFRNRATDGHEVFPELGELIARDYFLLADLGTERVYVRSASLLAESGRLRTSRLQQLMRTARRNPDFDSPPPESRVPASLGDWNIDGRVVHMLLPPGRITWLLDGTEREVALEYGFHPRAYREGHSNGADLLIELQSEGSAPRLLLRRHLDPARRAADRGPLLTRVILPPFAPGTRLVARTEPGEYGDAAWDWVYLASPRYLLAPYYLPGQFPGFARMPDLAEANDALLAPGTRDPLLTLNGPAALRYTLDGTERRLDFAYGFQTEAASVDRPPAGVTYRVEYTSSNRPMRVLFERHLSRPGSDVERGRQHAEVVLPSAPSDAHLVVRVTPDDGGTSAGSYVTDLGFQ